MGFDKVIEKMTIIDTAVLTLWLVFTGSTLLNALGVLVSIPVVGLAVLAIHEIVSDEYGCVKEAMKKRKRVPRLEDDWKQMLRDARTRYILCIVLAVIWNISAFIIIFLSLMRKFNL